MSEPRDLTEAELDALEARTIPRSSLQIGAVDVRALVRMARRALPGSYARTITVILERLAAGEPRAEVLADYRWEHDSPPSLHGLDAMLEAAEQRAAKLEAALRGLSYVPAVQYALNPSGFPHKGPCHCPWCVAQSLLGPPASAEKEGA